MQEESGTDVYSAIQSGNVHIVKELLTTGIPVNLTDEEGWSLLHHAAACDQVEVVLFLKENGCCVDAVDSNGRTPLHYAAANGFVDCIEVLISLGGRVNAVDEEGSTPLQWAIMCEQYPAVEELVKHGGTTEVDQVEEPIHSSDKSSEVQIGTEQISTQLHNSEEVNSSELLEHPAELFVRVVFKAAQSGNTVAIRECLDLGVPVDLTDNDGWSLVHHAIAHRQVEVIRLLMNRGCFMSPVKHGTQLLDDSSSVTKEEDIFDAARSGDTTRLKEYLDLGVPVDIADEDGRTPLHCAAGEGRVDAVKLLVISGCCVDPVDNNGWTPSMYAALQGEIEVHRLLNVVKSVFFDSTGWTPLHEAAANGELEMAKMLLAYSGGKKLMTVIAGEVGTPLHQAAANGHKDVVALLLRAGCPAGVRGSDGSTALHFSAQFGRTVIIEILVDHGLDANIVDNENSTPLHWAVSHSQLESVRTLLRLDGWPSLLVIADRVGTPLHQAATGHKDVVELLLNEGCPIDVRDISGFTALHVAAICGEVEIIEMLVKRGLDVNVGDTGGLGSTPLHSAAAKGRPESVRTLLRLGGRKSMSIVIDRAGSPLHQAASKGHRRVVSLLLSEGCPIDIRDSDGLTALHIAVKFRQFEIVELLAKHGMDVNIMDNYGCTPLHLASWHGQLALVHMLLRFGGWRSVAAVADRTGTPLHLAVVGGHMDVITHLLKEGCPIDIRDNDGFTLLHLAASHGHLGIIEVLVKHGLDVNIVCNRGRTPLLSAASAGQLESVRRLLRFGARKSMTTVADQVGSPLHQAALEGHKNVIALLLNEGCPIDIKDSDGLTALNYAANFGQVDVIEMLVNRGLDVNTLDNQGNTPLHRAAGTGQVESVHTLLRLGGRQSLLVVSDDSGTALQQAAAGGHKDIVKLLLSEGCPIAIGDSDGLSALHTAAKFGQVGIIEMLVERGLDVNIVSSMGKTPLHSAAAEGHLESVHALLRLGGRKAMTMVAGKVGTPLHQAAASGHKDVVTHLLKEGCPIDVRDSDGFTPLHFAAQCGQVDIIELLVTRGLDVNIPDNQGTTPLHSAAATGQLESVRTLLTLGERRALLDATGEAGTALHKAAEGGHKDMVALLLNEGCPIANEDSDGFTALHVAAKCGQVDIIEALVNHGMDVNFVDNKSRTPLHSAADGGHLESVRTLLRLGGRKSMSVVADFAGAPLHRAARGGHKDVITCLLDEGCPIGIRSSSGSTALHFAAEFGQDDVIEMLVERGLDVNSVDNRSNTPLHVAADNSQLESVRTLLRLGGKKSMTILSDSIGTPMHQAVVKGSKSIVALLLSEGYPQDFQLDEGLTALHVAANHGKMDLIDLLVDHQSDINAVDDWGGTPLHYAGYRLEPMQKLFSLGAKISHDKFEMNVYEHLIAQACVSSHELKLFLHACGITCDGSSFVDVVAALSENNLIDINRVLCLAAISGNTGMFDDIVKSDIPLGKQRMPRLIRALTIRSRGWYAVQNWLEGLHSLDDPLNPLHLSLISCRQAGPGTPPAAQRTFAERIIFHKRTQYTVHELFPNGLSPLDVARQFELHDIACMIEKVGGRPGMWADLPKEVGLRSMELLRSLKGLRSGGDGKNSLHSLLMMLGYHVNEEIESSKTQNMILEQKPKPPEIQKYVLSKVSKIRKWKRVGELLEIPTPILDKIGSNAFDSDDAYYSMLKYWLEHGHSVTWKTLHDAIGHFETKKTMDDIMENIRRELSETDVSTVYCRTCFSYSGTSVLQHLCNHHPMRYSHHYRSMLRVTV